MWYATLLSFAHVGLLLTATPETFAQELNFAVARANTKLPPDGDGCGECGKRLAPPFSLFATLLVAPIAWTSLQWATYRPSRTAEIKDARSFQEPDVHHRRLADRDRLVACPSGLRLPARSRPRVPHRGAAGYSAGMAAGKFSGVLLWPNIVAIALAAPDHRRPDRDWVHPQRVPDVNNCYIGMTRVMVAMSLTACCRNG